VLLCTYPIVSVEQVLGNQLTHRKGNVMLREVETDCQRDAVHQVKEDRTCVNQSTEKRLLARIYYLHPLVLCLFIIWFQHLLVFF